MASSGSFQLHFSSDSSQKSAWWPCRLSLAGVSGLSSLVFCCLCVFPHENAIAHKRSRFDCLSVSCMNFLDFQSPAAYLPTVCFILSPVKEKPLLDQQRVRAIVSKTLHGALVAAGPFLTALLQLTCSPKRKAHPKRKHSPPPAHEVPPSL